MVCVSHNASHTNLYISDVNSYKFSLSLERVVYFNPKKSANNNWIRYLFYLQNKSNFFNWPFLFFILTSYFILSFHSCKFFFMPSVVPVWRSGSWMNFLHKAWFKHFCTFKLFNTSNWFCKTRTISSFLFRGINI